MAPDKQMDRDDMIMLKLGQMDGKLDQQVGQCATHLRIMEDHDKRLCIVEKKQARITGVGAAIAFCVTLLLGAGKWMMFWRN